MPADFAEIYDEHVFTVYGFFAYRLESRADAEDLTQQTFERALRAWGRFDPERASVATWLLAIARNLLVDRHRREGGRVHEPIGEGGIREAELGTTELDPDLGLDPALAAALAALKPRDREVLALRFGAELTAAEIAELLDLSLANAQQILSRTLRGLRAALEDEGQAANGPKPASPSPATRRSSRPDPQ